MISRREFCLASGLALAGCDDAPREVPGGFVGVSEQRGHVLRDRTSWTAPAITRRTGVVIAGGGIAGLAAARALRLAGVEDFALLELEDQAGGNSRGTELAGIACPMGAHYLPVPGDDASEVQDLLEEFGLRQRVAGRWRYDERHLCHSPQERLFFQGHWQEGLLPVQGVEAATLAQYRRFALQVEQAQRAARFSIPTSKQPLAPAHQALDAMTFVAWLDREGLHDMHLRWYLDYCCRDDYGAGIAAVSAWAGIHYFASRHGFEAPQAAGEAVPRLDDGEHGVLTWPEGNGWLARRLAAPLAERLAPGRTVVRIEALRHGVEVDAWNAATGALERWQAAQCIVALPLFVAARVVQNPPQALREAAAQLRYAPWLVSNIHLREPLRDRPGAPPSWDNVVYGASGLGYVDATHQSLKPVPGATVLTHYHAPMSLHADPSAARRALLEQPWERWRDAVLAELAPAHADLPAKATRIESVRYGHAMSIPLPGVRSSAALSALAAPSVASRPPSAQVPRLQFAHADLSGYSIFEEAFTHGHHAGRSAAWRVGIRLHS